MWDGTFLPTGASYRTSTQRCLGAEYRSTARPGGLVGAPSSIVPCCPGPIPAWEILHGSSGLGRQCWKSPIPWQGMGWRDAQQPGLVIWLFIRTHVLPRSQFPGVLSLPVLMHLAGRAASQEPLSTSFRRALVTSADARLAHPCRQGATSHVPVTPWCLPAVARWWHPCLRRCHWGGKLAKIPL